MKINTVVQTLRSDVGGCLRVLEVSNATGKAGTTTMFQATGSPVVTVDEAGAVVKLLTKHEGLGPVVVSITTQTVNGSSLESQT